MLGMLEGNKLHTSQFAKDWLWAPAFIVEAKRNSIQLYNLKQELWVFSNPGARLTSGSLAQLTRTLASPFLTDYQKYCCRN